MIDRERGSGGSGLFGGFRFFVVDYVVMNGLFWL